MHRTAKKSSVLLRMRREIHTLQREQDHLDNSALKGIVSRTFAEDLSDN